MPLYKDQGIVLGSFKLGEADKILTILTQGSGKVRAVAKGIRRTKSRFGARLEPFTHVNLMLYRGRSLDTVTQAEILQPFVELGFRHLIVGFPSPYDAETMDRLIAEVQPRLAAAVGAASEVVAR